MQTRFSPARCCCADNSEVSPCQPCRISTFVTPKTVTIANMPLIDLEYFSPFEVIPVDFNGTHELVSGPACELWKNYDLTGGRPGPPQFKVRMVLAIEIISNSPLPIGIRWSFFINIDRFQIVRGTATAAWYVLLDSDWQATNVECNDQHDDLDYRGTGGTDRAIWDTHPEHVNAEIDINTAV